MLGVDNKYFKVMLSFMCTMIIWSLNVVDTMTENLTLMSYL